MRFKETQALPIARFVVEAEAKDKIVFDEDREVSKATFEKRLKMLLTNDGTEKPYHVFKSDES